MSKSAKDVRFTELRDMVAQQNNTINSLNKTIETMTAMLAEKDQRLAELTEELRLLRKKLFGSSEYSLAVKPPFQNAEYRRSRNGVPLSCRFIRYRSA